MKLSTADADLFFGLTRRLHFYVNQQRRILPDVGTVEDYVTLPKADKVQIRNALWEDPGLIDAYVAENPDDLPAEELAILLKWKRYVAGTFQIFRFLKKHTTLSQAATHHPDDLEELWKLEQQVRTALSRLQTVLSRAER